jgi:ATP-dependent RNA helicase HelY
VVDRLADERMLPAIVFVFSRAGCDAAVEQCVASGLRLTTSEEARTLQRIAEAHTADLSADDLDALEYDAWLGGLLAGFAAHHAGMVPPMKEAVEEAFAAGLVKVVFATETLSLGINMPARSVVIEKLSKFTGEHHEFLTPGEYTQLAGRAGRRGIDDVGFVIVLWNPFVTFDQVAGLASRRTYALASSFRPTYNMAVNLVRRYPPEVARHLLNLSFAQYHADRDVVALERLLAHNRELLARQQAAAHSDRGDVDEYRVISGELEAARRAAAATRPARLEALRPGDVVSAPRRGGRVVVLKQDRGRGGNRVLALTAGRDLVRLGPEDFRDKVRRIATIDLPRPFRPHDQRFQRAAADALRRLPEADDDEEGTDATRERVEELERDLAAHPFAGAPDRARVLRAAYSADRLEKEIARQERRVAGRTESLARQLDRVLAVLEAWGYVEGWTLTSAGELLARLYTETDLVVAESVREGLLDGLDPAELAAVASCFTYERRGPDADTIRPPAHWPSPRVAQRARGVEKIWRDLMLSERDGRLPETRQPDPGLSPQIAGWVRGDALASVLEDGELTGGDFVRNVKQCIDLLRQIGDVAPDAATAATARAAADACGRGVVAASSAVHVP